MRLELQALAGPHPLHGRVGPVDLVLATGEALAIAGPAGAGKSTLLDLIAGCRRADAGAIRLDGRDLTRRSRARRLRAGIAMSARRPTLFDDMSVADNLRAALLEACGGSWRPIATSHGDARTEARVAELANRFGLAPDVTTPAGALDPGGRRRLGLATTFALGAGVVVVDRPSAGVRDREAGALAATIVAAAAGRTLLVAEPDLDRAAALAPTVLVLDRGRVAAIGPAAEIARSRAIRAIYESSRHG